MDDRFYQNLTTYSHLYVGHGFPFACKLSDFSIDVLYWHRDFASLVKLIPRYFMYYESIFRIAFFSPYPSVYMFMCMYVYVCTHVESECLPLALSPLCTKIGSLT